MQRIMLICAQNTIHIISKNVKQNSINIIIIPSFSDHKKCFKKKCFIVWSVSFHSARKLWALWRSSMEKINDFP